MKKIYKKQYRLIAEYIGDYHFCDRHNVILIGWKDEDVFPIDYPEAWPDKPSCMFDYKILTRYKEIEKFSLTKWARGVIIKVIQKIENFCKKIKKSI